MIRICFAEGRKMKKLVFIVTIAILAVLAIVTYFTRINTVSSACVKGENVGFGHLEDLSANGSQFTLNARLTYAGGPVNIISMKAMVLVAGVLQQPVREFRLVCGRPLDVSVAVKTTRKDAVTVIYLRNVEDKLREVSEDYSKDHEAPLGASVLSDVAFLQNVDNLKEPQFIVATQTQIVPISLTRVAKRGDSEASVRISILGKDESIELGLGNRSKTEITLATACFENERQFEFRPGHPVATVTVPANGYARLTLQPKLESKLNLIHCYVIGAWDHNKHVMKAVPPIRGVLQFGKS
jgi:hypothetical protein